MKSKTESRDVTMTAAQPQVKTGAGIDYSPKAEQELTVYSVTKRVIDIIGATFGLILLSPVFLLVAVLIKLDSRGPAIHKQERLGLNGETFMFYKFRSMVSGAHKQKESLNHLNGASGPMFKIKEDPRITRIGNFLRKSSIDELPQLFNVLKGEMSLVGPRPPLPEEVREYTKEQVERLTIIPGITGLWQVLGRSDLTFDEQIYLDRVYIKNQSVWLDLGLLLLTIPAVLSRRGAY